MARTLTEYAKLDTDVVKKGVMEWIVYESPILQKLPFINISGNSYKYNVETTLAGTSWITPTDTVPESTDEADQRSTELKILIGDADVAKFAIKTNSTQNPEVVTVEKKAKAISYEFEDTFIHGQTTTASSNNQFKGLLRMMAELESTSTTDLDAVNNDQVLAMAADSGALTLDKLDELVDAIKPGNPDCLLMSRRARRRLNILARASGSALRQTQGQFGQFIDLYNGIPVLISDFLGDNFQDGASSVLDIANYDPSTTRATGYDNTIVFALKFGDANVCGLQAGPMEHENLGTVQNKDAVRHRFKWYCGAAVFHKYSAAALININPDAS